MRAVEIRPGDELRHADGALSYVVVDVERDTVPSHDKVYATVQYVDGGYDRRAWLADDEVPLRRPEVD